MERSIADPALRLRLAGFARRVAWLDEAGERREQAATMREVLLRATPGPGEVELACALNRGHALEASLGVLPPVDGPARPGALAMRACLGESSLRPAILRGIADPADDQVQAVVAYLRHFPVDDPAELRDAVRRIAALGSSNVQARALDALARLRPGDGEVLQAVLGIFASTRSPAVQRAAAEVLLRADRSGLEREAMVAVLLRHRLPGEGAAMVDAIVKSDRER